MPDKNSESFQEREARFQKAAKLGDGLENLVTGLGTSADKNTHNTWSQEYRNNDYDSLTARFREDWVAQKICEILPQDMTRKWRLISTPEGRQADKEFDIKKKFNDAYKWARVYGTSCILLDVKDGKSLEAPLRIHRLKTGCIKSLQVVDRTRLFGVGAVETDPLSVNYGFPEFYQLGGSAQKIHHSRILRFEGTELPRYQVWRNQWYSDSVLIPMMDMIDNFHVAAASAASLVQEASVDVVKVDGLQDLVTYDDGYTAIQKRLRLMKQMKSVHNILLMDGSEEHSNSHIALNGVKDLIWEYLRVVAAAVNIPATRFLAASPDGMNATGESDLNNYIDMITGLQSSVFDPRLRVIDKLLQAHFGLGEWEYDWVCTYPESRTQEATRRQLETESVAGLVQAGVVTPEDGQKMLAHLRLYGDFKFSAPPKQPPLNQDKDGSKS